MLVNIKILDKIGLIMALSSNGQDNGFSFRQSGFDSP